MAVSHAHVNGASPSPCLGRILVVDDNDANRDLLGRRLERAGYQVSLRADAVGIEDDVILERIDLVLLDWMMPLRSGLNTLQGLRERFDIERTPVIVVTAAEDDKVLADAFAAGANDYIAKPVNVRVLLARLNAQLAHRAATLELDAIREGLEAAVRERTRDLTVEIAEREAAEEKAQAMALHDALTGLPNRRNLLKLLDERLARMREGESLAIVAVDLDRFKPVNDLYGHAIGDELLVRIGAMLRAETSASGFAARLGGDEFILVLPHEGDEQLLARLSALIAAFHAPFALQKHEVCVGATLGVALAPFDGRDAEMLMRRADIALYRAKGDGRGRFAFFEAGMDARVEARAALEYDLRNAIRNGDVEPHFQPLVVLATGEIRGYEILARWRCPQRGLVPAGDFIPIAEEAGLIGDLTLNILRRACGEALGWPGAPRIALNISPLQLKDAALAQKLLKVLAETGFPAQRLEIEITENALVADFDAARLILVSLKNQGVHISIDDFGTGYSSLRHLHELPFDTLKIDQSFVRAMSDSAETRTLIKTIIALANNLRLKVTAEGVESAEHVATLQALGCELGQGYYFGRAVPAVDIAASLHPQRQAFDSSSDVSHPAKRAER